MTPRPFSEVFSVDVIHPQWKYVTLVNLVMVTSKEFVPSKNNAPKISRTAVELAQLADISNTENAENEAHDNRATR